MRTLKCFCLECGIWNQVKSENFETEEICFECGGELKVVGEYRAIFLGMSLKDQNEKRAILRQRSIEHSKKGEARDRKEGLSIKSDRELGKKV